MIRADELDDGLVLDGEIYALGDVRVEWAPCSCNDRTHRFAGPWTGKTKARDIAGAHARHLVRRVVAITHVEEER